MYVCDNWYVLYVLVDCQLAIHARWPADSHLKRTPTICCIYTLLPRDDEQLASPKHVETE
jgi:hypothetical protein